MPTPVHTPTPKSTTARKSYRSLAFVALNGLIVSIAAYLLLQLFATQATQINAVQQSETVQNDLNAQINTFHNQIAPFSYLLKLDPEFSNLTNYIETQKLKGNFPKLKFLYWWPKQADIGYPGKVIHGDNQEGYAALPRIKDALENALKENQITPVAPGLIALDSIWPPDTRHTPLESGGWSRVRASTVAFVYDVYHADGRAGWLVAVISFHDALDLARLSRKLDIQHLDVLGPSQQIILDTYPVTLTSDPERPALPPSASDTTTFPLSTGIKDLKVSVQLSPSQEITLLSSIPNVMLIFGLILTAFGTLYVRGNMRQSEVMRQVNKTLALKNLEMNNQATDRERLNQALRRTEQESRAIMNAVSDVIFELDETGKILFLNSCWTHLTGADINATIGTDFFEYLADTEESTQRNAYLEMLSANTAPVPYSTTIKGLNDKTRRVDVRYTMVRKDDPNHPRVVGTIADIEDQIQAQKTILEAEERYRAFWENSPSGLYQIDPSGKLISANPALARMFGFETSDQMLDQVQSVQDTVYGSPRDYHDLMRTIHNTQIVTNVERSAKHRDGTLFWVFETARGVYDSTGKLICIEGSLDDITERKQAVEKLQEAKNEAEMANRSKTEFLANMSHELRTPLNAIIGFSEIIKDQILGPLGQDQYLAYARDIHDSGKNLLAIINTILDVARIEAGERQLNEDRVDLSTVVDTVIELINPKILNANQTIEVNIPPDLPYLLAEELAVKQILLNLVSNAVKFTPVGGHITITATAEKGAGLRMDISDTGIGLDDEEIHRIMAPFGQASGRFDRSANGPGLGLTLVHSLMRLHGGTFEILSQKGVGTTASVTFPDARLLRDQEKTKRLLEGL